MTTITGQMVGFIGGQVPQFAAAFWAVTGGPNVMVEVTLP